MLQERSAQTLQCMFYSMHLHNHILLKNILTKDKGLNSITRNTQQILECANTQIPVKAHLSPVSSQLPFHSTTCNNPLTITHLTKETTSKIWNPILCATQQPPLKEKFHISPPIYRGALSRSPSWEIKSHPVTTIKIFENSALGARGTWRLEG